MERVGIKGGQRDTEPLPFWLLASRTLSRGVRFSPLSHSAAVSVGPLRLAASCVFRFSDYGDLLYP